MSRLASLVGLAAVLASSASGQSVQSLLLPDLLDSRTPSARLASRVAQLNDEAVLQTALGNFGAAAAAGGMATYVADLDSGLQPIPPATANEVHVVSFYEGAPAPLGQPRTANVTVTQSGAPITLFLNCYETISWTINPLPPGSTLQEIVLISYDPQLLAGVPPGVPVTQLDLNNGGTYYGGPEDMEGRVDIAAECLVRWGRFATTFTGAYTAPASAVEIGPGSADWRKSYAIGFAEAQVATLCVGTAANQYATFGADVYIPLLTPSMQSFFGSTTPILANPFGALSGPLLSVSGALQYTFDDNLTVYVLGSSGVPKTLNVQTLAQTNLPSLPVGMTAISNPKGLTYDSFRNRLLLSTTGGVGYLYTFDVATSTWGVLASLAGKDLAAICYDPGVDLTYGLDVGVFGGQLNIVRYDATGAQSGPASTCGLNFWGYGFYNHQMYLSNGKLIAIGPGKQIFGSLVLRQCFVIDPANGDILSATFLLT